jgi:ribosomal protein S18 acetylase RimI-like enzyme
MKIKKLKYNKVEDISLLKKFLEDNSSGTKNFRYFEKRPLEIIKNHIVTYIFFDGVEIIGYGHLDLEDGLVWLGVMVSEKYRGKGFGKKIVKKLIKCHNGDITLSVDSDNKKAYNLYSSLKFTIIEKKDKIIIMKLNK